MVLSATHRSFDSPRSSEHDQSKIILTDEQLCAIRKLIQARLGLVPPRADAPSEANQFKFYNRETRPAVVKEPPQKERAHYRGFLGDAGKNVIRGGGFRMKKE
jgi:hypothetical protein